jgi:hypothetical protein
MIGGQRTFRGDRCCDVVVIHNRREGFRHPLGSYQADQPIMSVLKVSSGHPVLRVQTTSGGKLWPAIQTLIDNMMKPWSVLRRWSRCQPGSSVARHCSHRKPWTALDIPDSSCEPGSNHSGCAVRWMEGCRYSGSPRACAAVSEAPRQRWIATEEDSIRCGKISSRSDSARMGYLMGKVTWTACTICRRCTFRIPTLLASY